MLIEAVSNKWSTCCVTTLGSKSHFFVPMFAKRRRFYFNLGKCRPARFVRMMLPTLLPLVGPMMTFMAVIKQHCWRNVCSPPRNRCWSLIRWRRLEKMLTAALGWAKLGIHVVAIWGVDE